MPETVLRVEEVSKHFGGLWAVDGTSLTLEEGQVRGLIGPNGAGKTSLLNCISGLLIPDRGRIRLLDREVTRLPMHRRTPLGIARTFQSPQIFGGLSVAENVWLAAHVGAGGDRHGRRRVQEILEWMELAAEADRNAGDLPYGLQKRVEMARALALRPRVLLLDEPATGLNPEEIAHLNRLIRQIAERGVGVLVVEHNMRVVMTICQRITVMNFGKVIAEGTPSEVASNPEVVAAYLGTGGKASHVAP
jgi:ABC-type branched-subunit amino acid transport system ATPase component